MYRPVNSPAQLVLSPPAMGQELMLSPAATAGFGRVPAYTDISHFRAPYKNVYISGFGGENMHNAHMMSGFGQEPPSAAPPAPDPVAALLMADEEGNTRLKPEVQTLFMQSLQAYSTTGDAEADQVNIAPLPPGGSPQGNALTWVDAKVKQGMVVYADRPTVVAVATGTATMAGVGSLFAMKPGSEEAKQAKAIGMVVVAGDPDKGMFAALMGPAGIALAAVAVVGGGYLLLGNKRRYKSNAVRMKMKL